MPLKDLVNVDLDAVILLLSHLEPEMYLFPVVSDFPHPVRSENIRTNYIQLLDLTNVGLTVGISILSQLEAKLLHPVWSDSIRIGPIEQLD